MKNDNLPKGYVTGLEAHERIKQSNLKHMRKQEFNNALSTILCIVFFPIAVIFFLIIGLGTKKK